MDLSWLLAVGGGAFWLGIVVRGLAGPASSSFEALVEVAAGVGTLALLMSSRSIRARPHVVLIGVMPACILLGAGRTALADATIRASPLTQLQDRTVELVGSLGSDPAAGRIGWHAVLDVARVHVTTASGSLSEKAGGAVWLEGYGRPPAARQGDRALVTGLLRAPHGGFAASLRHRGLASACSIGELRVLGPSANPVWRAADTVRGALGRSVARVLPARQAGLLLGLALGDTSRLDLIVEDQFRATGLSHLTAVSGENVAMFLAPILGSASHWGRGRSCWGCCPGCKSGAAPGSPVGWPRWRSSSLSPGPSPPSSGPPP